MKYEDRYICFIDILGFKELIKQTNKDSDLLNALYEIMSGQTPKELRKLVYGQFASVDLKKNEVVSANETSDTNEVYSDKYPITISQFSDSYVLSCPSSNKQSTIQFLQLICILHLSFFIKLGVFLRGGVTKGPVIHQENGALFGPAIIDAYEIESKQAKYPRVCMNQATFKDIQNLVGEHYPTLTCLAKQEDFYSIDIVSVLKTWVERADLNKDVENDTEFMNEYIECGVLPSMTESQIELVKPKLDYLKQRWEDTIGLTSDERQKLYEELMTKSGKFFLTPERIARIQNDLKAMN